MVTCGWCDTKVFIPGDLAPLGTVPCSKCGHPIMMPMMLTTSAGTTFQMNFDVQIKTVDCPTVIDNRYSDPITVGPGYIVYIRKPFDIFVQPGNTYGATDRLAGNNGTLKYIATNV